MGVAYANADGAILTGGTAVNPSGTLDDALSDSDDATNGEFPNGGTALLSTETPTIPAGAVLLGVGVTVRAFGIGSQLTTTLAAERASDGAGIQDQRVQALNKAAYTEWVAAWLSGDDLDLDTLAIGFIHASGGNNLIMPKAQILALYIAKPVVDVLEPSGTLTEQNRPAVRWSNTLDSLAGAQSDYEVALFLRPGGSWSGFDPDAATPVAGELGTGAATEWRPADAIANGIYRAYVRVKQAASNWSDWNYNDVELDVDPPADPTLTAESDSENGRVALTYATGGGSPDTTFFELEHKSAAGEWVPVRTATGGGRLETTDPATVFDYEVPFGTARHRIRAAHLYPSTGAIAYSGWVDTETPHSGGWWLKHPTDPRLNTDIMLRSFPGHSRAARLEVVSVLGRDDAVAIGDTRGPQTGTIVIRAGDDATRDAVAEIATDPVPLLLQAEPGHHEPDRWVVLGDEDVTRRVDQAFIDERDLTYPFTVVARPDTATSPLEVWERFGSYVDEVLADQPALLWRLDDSTSVDTVADASGNGNHGTKYDAGVPGHTNIQTGFWVPPYAELEDFCAFSLANWSGAPLAQQHPGVGIRADDYKPFVPGSQRSFEVWVCKTDPNSFATVWSGDGMDKPATTVSGAGQTFTGGATRTLTVATIPSDMPEAGTDLIIAGVTGRVSYTHRDATHFYNCVCAGSGGTPSNGATVEYGVGAPHPTWEMGETMMRFYATVNTFPLGWIDWGTDNTRHPRSDFVPSTWCHLVGTYDDGNGEAEWFIDGVSQGKQFRGDGFGGVPVRYSEVDPGNFQFGWRGDYTPPGNTECFGGLYDEIAVYEYILSPAQIRRHYLAGIQ